MSICLIDKVVLVGQEGFTGYKMYCQKCRTPLHLHSSLEHLNPTAFNLLIEASGKSSKEQQNSNNTSPAPLLTDEAKQRYEEASRNASTPIFSQHYGNRRDERDPKSKDANPAMSYVMLTESQVASAPPSPSKTKKSSQASDRPSKDSSNGSKTKSNDSESLSSRMETTNQLFSILSSRSDIDHPICVECTDLLLRKLELRLSNASKERDAYLDYLRNAQADCPTEAEAQAAEKELSQIRTEEERAMLELEELEEEKSKLEDEIAALELENEELDEEEEAFWRERNAFEQTLSAYIEERDSINVRYQHDLKQLEKLQKTNVYNDTFCISHNSTGFATINNLRLGNKLRGVSVEWAEINAAWGLATLLLATVAEKLGFEFSGYKLNPIGSTSTIHKLDISPSNSTSKDSTHSSGGKSSTTTLPLYYSSDLPLNLGFLHRGFDSAMVAFLECLRQLGKHVEETTSQRPSATAASGIQTSSRSQSPDSQGQRRGLKLPYNIEKDKIGDVSIKLGTGFGADESWTKACKMVLACCKFLLAHASNISGQRGGGGSSADG